MEELLINLEREKKNFEDHVATFTDYGNIKILDFKKPDSGHYRIRFLFEEDFHRLHITGDLGELIATNHYNMTYEGFGDFVRDTGYFEGKIDCHSRPIYLYEYDKAKEDLDRIFDEMEMQFIPEAWDDRTPEQIREETIKEVCAEIYTESGMSQNGWEMLEKYDPDCIEYCMDIGKVRTGILELYMLAFELAQEQLRKNEKGTEE